MRSTQIATLAAAAAFGATAILGAEQSVAPSACTPTWKTQWGFTRDHEVGLAVWVDPRTRVTGPYAGRKKAAMLAPGAVWGKNWFPIDGYKHTICGTVKDFTVFDPLISGAETDFHMFLNLASPFAYALQDVTGVSSSQEFYGEITLPKPLREENWFKKKHANPVGSSPTERVPLGAPACAYGAWVTEEAHDMQPELHPMEQFWFQEGQTLHWVTALDSSHRFDKAKYYCGIVTPKKQCDAEMSAAKNFLPWANFATRAIARIPFEVISNGARLTATVGTATATATVTVNGAVQAGVSRQVRVEPKELCTEGSTLRGYFEVTLPQMPAPYAHVLITGSPMAQIGPQPSSAQSPPATREREPASIDEQRIERIKGVGYRAPTFNSQGSAVESPLVRMRVNPSIDDVHLGEGTLEFDISPQYVDANGSDEDPLAQFLTGALYGALPGVGPDVSLTSAHVEQRLNRYAGAFGDRKACFKPTARALLDGKTNVPVLAENQCNKFSGLRVCQEEEKDLCAVQSDGDLLDYKVYGKGFRGLLTISGEVEDPIGLKAPFAITVPLPVQARPPVVELIKPVITEARLSAVDAAILERWQPGIESPSVADPTSLGCDAKARAAREFWMLAYTFTRHGALDGASSVRLSAVLDRFKAASVGCGAS